MSASELREQAAIEVLVQAMCGITAARGGNPDPTKPDLAGDFTVDDEGRITAKIELPSGDVYELAVRWVPEESP